MGATLILRRRVGTGSTKRAASRACRGSAASRPLRESIPSLPKTLCRCHSTVRGLRNNWAPICALVSPSRASRAICSSCGVSSSRRSSGRLRGFAPAATSSPRARSANASIPISANISSAARSRSRASLRRPSRRSHSPYTRWLRASSGRRRVRLEPLDRLAIRRFGCVAVGEQRPRTRLDAERDVATCRLRGRREPVQRIVRELRVADAGRSLDQLAPRPHRQPRKEAVRVDLSGCRCRLLVATEAVVQHRGGPVRDHHRVSLPTCGALSDDGLDQRRGLGLPPLQRQDPEQRERRDLVPDRCRDALALGHEPSRAGQVAQPALVPVPEPGGGSAALRARPRRGRAGPGARSTAIASSSQIAGLTPPACETPPQDVLDR